MRSPLNNKISGAISDRRIAAFRLIDVELGRAKRLIAKQLRSCSDKARINQLLEYFNSCGGKMLRPGLVLLAGASCGKITDEHICVAAIVEMIHNATLLHDDVIDEGSKRRGLPTVNSLWGNESAVLLGDFLLSQVFKMCAELKPEVTRIIAGTTAHICEGELRQTVQRQNWQLSESEYIDIITGKSGALFSGACFLGGLLSNASKTQAKLLSDFGCNFGIAFQIADDLLDIVGDESKMGKAPGSDANKHKPTLATIHWLRTADDRNKIAAKGILNTAGTNESARAEMIRMLSSSDSLKYAQNRAQEFVEKATRALAGFKGTEAKHALIDVAESITCRVITS